MSSGETPKLKKVHSWLQIEDSVNGTVRFKHTSVDTKLGILKAQDCSFMNRETGKTK